MTVVLKRLKDNTQWQLSLSLPDVSKGQNRCTLHSLDLSFSHKNLHDLTYIQQQNK